MIDRTNNALKINSVAVRCWARARLAAKYPRGQLAIAKMHVRRSAWIMALAFSGCAALNPTAKRVTNARVQSAAVPAIARSVATVAASLALVVPDAASAAVCDFAPTSDLCVQERQREALKPKAKGDKGKGPAMAIAKPVAKPPAPPAPKLTKEAQAVADAEATIAKMEKKKKDMTAQFESQKAKVDAMPEVKEMLKMQEQMKSAVKEYDSSVPRMKAQLPKMKEVRDKKAKKDKFVAQNKARREKKEKDAKAAQKKAEDKKRADEKARKEKKAIQEKADAEKKKIQGGGASWSPFTGFF